MAVNYLTLIHILISLIGIASGFGAVAGMLAGKLFPKWVAWFLVTTIATSVTGFFFPIRGFTPAIGVGILSLLLLPVSVYALYRRELAGGWRVGFVVTSVAALYLNFFVLIVQTFLKNPALAVLAPTQSEPAFAVTQLIVLVSFVVLGVAAVKQFSPEAK